MTRVQTRAFNALRSAYREQSATTNAPCWLCGQQNIDYDAPYDDYSNDSRFQLDHYWPVSTHPELQEDPANFRPSHAGCNRERGNKAPRPGLGAPSQAWV